MIIRLAIVAVVMLAAFGSLVGLGLARAQDTTGQEGIVGSWMLTFPENPDAPPSFYTFSADGTVVGSSASGARHGAWQQGEDGQVVEFTVVGLADVGRGPAVIPIRINGEAAVGDDGNTVTITYVVEPLDPQLGGVIAAGPFTATGTRVAVEEFELPATPEAAPDGEAEATPVV